MELDTLTIVALVLPLVLRNDPIPQHDSILTGQLYYREVMKSPSSNRFSNVARMDKETFILLKNFLYQHGRLRRSKTINIGQKIMIFIHVLIGHTNRQTAERWQHSGSTISLIIHEVSESFRACSHLILVRPKLGDPVQNTIAIDPTLSPFFDNCIGAIDGVHISAFVPQEEHKVFIDRKKNLTQNVLGAVNFDMTFSYVLTGWEGRAHDGRVYEDAKTKGFPSVDGKFFLGDAGYALSSTCLTPYRGVRYHLKEFNAGNAGGPRNAKELYNLKHSSLRNVVERCFGVMKKRFPILVVMPSFYYPYQCVLVSCCFLLHNFIRRNQLYEDDFFIGVDADIAAAVLDGVAELDDVGGPAIRQWRDGIANSMWLAYQAHLGGN
jgi:DDE superfamily endonuclease